jgi:hypothetical protein
MHLPGMTSDRLVMTKNPTVKDQMTMMTLLRKEERRNQFENKPAP